MSDILVKMNVSAPMPQMHRDAAERYNRLRETVRVGAGIDFLAKCGEMLRPAGYMSNKDGVANRSWHKTGRAFDYDQESSALVIVSEIIGGRQYFRTYLVCARQDGTLGVKRTLRDMRGFTKTAYVFDFTAAAEAVGFKRIPAWNGWQKNYNRREFWHFQYDEGKTWDAAMLELKGKARTADAGIYGLNDRGDAVKNIQSVLLKRGLLKPTEVDGVYGAKTKASVEVFQKSAGIDADGIVGPATSAKLLAF